ncbi:threonine/serine exporter family protein [Tissierella creatinophila]|uniref:Inner membrane protein YjjP n=1 Tax=Tissierella creatinophila DSM 6911 TaxID=1123403 RepID=A0A1U7M2Y3_TISCR|nr:threonine/serine exporter family protein [Tissierella creatinophila]OLS01682.1 inner membrane protein YjjP [Tissierella creatinophila DSM 6911]
MNHFIIKNRKDVQKLSTLAIFAGKTMLSNGAETYRVEDTINRICSSKENIKEVDSFVTQSGFFLTLEYEGEIFTYLKRVKDVGINLNKINLVNDFSRQFVNQDISLEKGMKTLDEINNIPGYPKYLKILGGSYVSGFFSLMYGGSPQDFLPSFIASFISLIILDKLSKFNLTFFIDRFIGAFLSSLLAIFAVKLGIGVNLDKIIIGSIMYLVPGVSITNSIRDTMSGDSLSGLSKGIEAILSALAIAFGVGIVLNLKSKGWI